MGYYTDYRLELEGEYSDNIISELRDEYEGAKYGLTDEGYTEESVKWYDAESDLIKFSRKYPNTIFKLFGNGEQDDDIWVFFVKNGKSYREDLFKHVVKFKPSKLRAKYL